MKLVYILVIIVLFAATGFTQAQIAEKKVEDPCKDIDPLPPDAFNKMIIQDITFAIVGESAPTSGIKIDISKPEANISAVFPINKPTVWWNPISWIDLFGVEFKGGVTDGNFSILKGFNSFNTAFEIRPNFHFIPANSSAKYGVCVEALPKTLIINAQNDLVRKDTKAAIDTFYANVLIRKHYLEPIKIQPVKDITLPVDTTVTDDQKKAMISLIMKYIGKDTLKTTAEKDSVSIFKEKGKINIIKINTAGKDSLRTTMGEDSVRISKRDPTVVPISKLTISEIQNAMPKATMTDRGILDHNAYIDAVEKDFQKGLKRYKSIKTDTLARMIINAAEVWTKKTYWWITVSPFARTEKVNEYYTTYKVKDSLYFKSDYQFYYGITGYINHYIVLPNKTAHYIRLGVSLAHNNNLTNLSNFSYETSTPLFSHGSTHTEKTKTGTAYNHSDILTGFVSQLNFDYYLLPLNTFTPGAYVSTNVGLSDLYRLPKTLNREDDKIKIALEGGLIFNINSREKSREKSILSIQFYVRSEDITDERRTPIETRIEETRDDFRKRNLSSGIRVGIPINLPQRSN